jgi:mevalonate pyrophosphate decarboxylase
MSDINHQQRGSGHTEIISLLDMSKAIGKIRWRNSTKETSWGTQGGRGTVYIDQEMRKVMKIVHDARGEP